MTQLSDLPDNCLLEVLEWLAPEQLFKIQRVNRLMKRLAVAKLGVKIEAIEFRKSSKCFSDCAHLGNIRPDQVLVVEPMFDDIYTAFKEPSREAFLNLFSMCSNVKSIDFNYIRMPDGLALEVVRRCPQLECIKSGMWIVKVNEWEQVLDRVGPNLVHFVKKKQNGVSSIAWLVEIIASKCLNLKQIDWLTLGHLSDDLVTAFKMLPKSCWIKVNCDYFSGFEDDTDIDQLNVYSLLNWSALRHCNRLSILKVKHKLDSGLNLHMQLNRLKKLEIGVPICCRSCIYNVVEILLTTRFPHLEEFSFMANDEITEEDYKGLFQQMPSIMKLGIFFQDTKCLPRSAIHLLKILNIFDLNILDVGEDWQPDDFLQELEQYVERIYSLKKLTLDFGNCKIDEWKKKVIEGVERMKLNQTRVEIVLVFGK